MTSSVSTPPAPLSDLDPFDDDFLADPYPAHRQLREQPVTWLARYDVFAMARYTDVCGALRDPQTFCSAAGVGLSDFRREKPWRPPSLLLEADPPEHTAARKVVTQVLTPTVVRGLKEQFLHRARAVVAELVGRQTFDGVADLAAAFPLAVFPDAVGLPEAGREKLLPYGAMVFNGFGPRNVHFERAMANAEEVSGWIMRHCERDALAPNGFGAQIHIAAAEAGYSRTDAARIVRSFLSAGVDTTVHGIGNALLCLAEHPDQWELLREDPRRARTAFEEVIRFESPVQTFCRTTTSAVTVADTEIPSGSKVLLFLGAANRDERQYPDPERFDITRKIGGHVGFGSGIHACVGQMLARLEGEVVLTAMAEQAQTLRISGPIQRDLNNTLRGLKALPLTVTT
jgi:cytochrome P450